MERHGRSVRTRHALQLCSLYAPLHRPVLFLGPVGVGKTTLARTLHAASGRTGRFVAISAGELTEHLFADTLFGHVAGAFTGASGGHAGALEQAADGTLLLDDLALMTLPVQAAILRVLEERRYRPLGAREDRAATCHILFASTVELRALVESGSMLPDLPSRVGEFVIPVPSLAERAEEIIPLATEIGERFLGEHGCTGRVEFSHECAELLTRYPWPNNLRELRGTVERAIVHAGMSSNPVRVRPAHLPERLHETFESGGTTGGLTRALVEDVLRETGGNQAEAARRLGVHRNTIARYR